MLGNFIQSPGYNSITLSNLGSRSLYEWVAFTLSHLCCWNKTMLTCSIIFQLLN